MDAIATGTVLASNRFEAYGTAHQAVLTVLLAGIVPLVFFGRRYRGTGRADDLGRLLAVAIVMFAVPMQLLQFAPGRWDLQTSLPVQLCDLAWMVSVYALWTHSRWAAALSYFWGLTLTTQAIITPDLGSVFPEPGFFMYWGMHLLVVWAAVYLTWGLGLFPDWRRYGVAVAATAAWVVGVFLLNAVADTNYGYLNEKPESASILDLLGPWPWYVLAEIAIIVVAWALLTWPWVAANPHVTPRSAVSSR